MGTGSIFCVYNQIDIKILNVWSFSLFCEDRHVIFAGVIVLD